jgi:hypothetical protein
MRVVVGNVEHDVKVAACMSVPRLGFQDNFFTSFAALSPHGIQVTKGTGAFWDQTMSRILTDLSKEETGNQWIVTLDYDSVFEPDCLTRLMGAALLSGVDAIAPLQTKRDDKTLMFTPEGLSDRDAGPVTVSLPADWWEKPAQSVDTAHFGLTLIRTAALRRTPKPWFIGEPGPDGDWGDGRRDPDIAFWHRFRKAGNTIAICPQVSIGHAELVITWPDQRLNAIYQYPTHYWNSGGKRPPEAWGSEAHAERSMQGRDK